MDYVKDTILIITCLKKEFFFRLNTEGHKDSQSWVLTFFDFKTNVNTQLCEPLCPTVFSKNNLFNLYRYCLFVP